MEKTAANAGNPVICVILAGGQSRRMGRDKAALPFGSGTFLSHLIGVYSPAFPVFVSVGEAEKFPHPGAEELVDLHPGMGPLAGLEAAFSRTGAEIVFLTATDLPFGTPALARALLERLGSSDACVIRRASGEMEMAFGVYRRTCLPRVEALLARDRRAVRALLDEVDARIVEEADLPEFDLPRLLTNVNTPEAYREALDRL